MGANLGEQLAGEVPGQLHRAVDHPRVDDCPAGLRMYAVARQQVSTVLDRLVPVCQDDVLVPAGGISECGIDLGLPRPRLERVHQYQVTVRADLGDELADLLCRHRPVSSEAYFADGRHDEPWTSCSLLGVSNAG